MKYAFCFLMFITVSYQGAFCLEISHIGTFSFEEMGIKSMSGNAFLWSYDVLASGKIGYLSMYNGFSIIDITDFVHPKGISFLTFPGYYEKLTQVNDSIVAGYGVSGVIFIDVSTINSPSILSVIQTRDWVNDIEFEGNTAYIADASDGLLVADITSITSPIIVSTYKEYGSANGLEIVGKVLYADFAGTINQMVVFDISSKFPVYKNSIQGAVGLILRSNSKNYLVSNLMKIFDIADPFLPGLLTTIYPQYGVRVSGMVVDDDYIYASGPGAIPDTDGQDVFMIYDIKSEAHDVVAEWVRYDTNWFFGMFMEYNIVYIADGENGLTILRIESESDVQDNHWNLYQ